MNPDNDDAFNEFWRGLSPEEQLELIQQSLNEEIAAGRIVELLPVNGKRTHIGPRTGNRNWSKIEVVVRKPSNI